MRQGFDLPVNLQQQNRTLSGLEAGSKAAARHEQQNAQHKQTNLRKRTTTIVMTEIKL